MGISNFWYLWVANFLLAMHFYLNLHAKNGKWLNAKWPFLIYLMEVTIAAARFTINRYLEQR